VKKPEKELTQRAQRNGEHRETEKRGTRKNGKTINTESSMEK
jgi:hypothetical protein